MRVALDRPAPEKPLRSATAIRRRLGIDLLSQREVKRLRASRMQATSRQSGNGSDSTRSRDLEIADTGEAPPPRSPPRTSIAGAASRAPAFMRWGMLPAVEVQMPSHRSCGGAVTICHDGVPADLRIRGIGNLLHRTFNCRVSSGPHSARILAAGAGRFHAVIARVGRSRPFPSSALKRAEISAPRALRATGRITVATRRASLTGGQAA
jgi:hypothetical protein